MFSHTMFPHVLRWRLVGLLLAILLISSSGIFAWAQDATAILTRASALMNAPRDATLLESVEIRNSRGKITTRILQVQQKRQSGKTLRLIRFLEPANVAGVSFLSLGEDRMYLYPPAFRKVRRIASHVKNENFAGTDFSYEDLSETDYAQRYEAALIQEDQNSQEVKNSTDGSFWTLKLTPRPGVDTSYSHAIMRVDRETNYPIQLELFRDDRQLKRLELSDIRERDGYLTAGKLQMTTIGTDQRTTLTLQQVSFDQGLSDDLFTQRNLKRWKR